MSARRWVSSSVAAGLLALAPAPSAEPTLDTLGVTGGMVALRDG